MLKMTTKEEGVFALVVAGIVAVVSVWSSLVGVLIAVVALTLFAINEFKKEMRSGQPMNPLKAANEARQQEKAQNREKLMRYLDSHETLTNDDVQQLLNVSHATATRYLDELQEDDLIREVGEGAGTHYRRKE